MKYIWTSIYSTNSSSKRPDIALKGGWNVGFQIILSFRRPKWFEEVASRIYWRKYSLGMAISVSTWISLDARRWLLCSRLGLRTAHAGLPCIGVWTRSFGRPINSHYYSVKLCFHPFFNPHVNNKIRYKYSLITKMNYYIIYYNLIIIFINIL